MSLDTANGTIDTGPFVSDTYAKTIIDRLYDYYPQVEDTLRNFPGLLCAGGFPRDLAVCDAPKDVDLWTPDIRVGGEVARYLEEREMPVLGVDSSRRGITSLYYPGAEKTPWWQVIHGYAFRSAQDLIEAFDFSVCQIAFWWYGTSPIRGVWKFAASPQWEPDMESRTLRYVGLQNQMIRTPADNVPVPMVGGHSGSLARSWKLAARLGLSVDTESMGKLLAFAARSMEHQRVDGRRAYPTRALDWVDMLEKVEDYDMPKEGWVLDVGDGAGS